MSERNANLRKKFEIEIGPADWKTLRPHLLRDAVILVAPDLDLIDVGIKVAEDDKAAIVQWIRAGKLTKPTPREAAVWEKGETDPLAVIVSPFVLVQQRRQTH